jgi:TPR repeat protein
MKSSNSEMHLMQALDEAADNLTKAQNTVMSGIENRLGVACVQLGKYKEAHTYFQKAVQLGSAPAAFNMGLCYETGAGTQQDLKLVCSDTADRNIAITLYTSSL